MKILIIGTQLSYVYNFRMSLIETFVQLGHKVHVIASKDCEIRETTSFKFYNVLLKNSSVNPLTIRKYKANLRQVISEISPDILFTFTLKPNVYAIPVAKKLGIKKIFAMVEGRGRVYNGKGLVKKLLRIYVNYLQKVSFKNAKAVFLLNREDNEYYLKKKILREHQAVLLNGIGVNLTSFSFCPMPEKKSLLMVARLLPEKGVWEYCRLSRRLKTEFPDIRCYLLGGQDKITKEDLCPFIEDGSIIYEGIVQNVYPYLQNSSIFVLPSFYKEGVPRSIMEAMATGRPILTTLNQGCNTTVKDGFNGYRISIGDEETLFNLAKKLLTNHTLASEMGKNSRLMCEQLFDEKIINAQIVSTILEG